MPQREARRFRLRIRLLIRPLNSSEAHLAAETENISATGAFFLGNFPLAVGTQVEMLITLPEALVGHPSHVWLCMGRVVRVSHGEWPGGKLGIGVEFHFHRLLDRQEKRVVLDQTTALVN
jgi:PilZ domain-containing protein